MKKALYPFIFQGRHFADDVARDNLFVIFYLSEARYIVTLSVSAAAQKLFLSPRLRKISALV